MTAKYHETLPHDDREDLFEFMRTIDLEAGRLEAHHRALAPRHGEIAVGAAHFDPWLRAEVIREYLSGLRNGLNPSDALDNAIEYGRKCVRVHNSKRPKDINWQRWEDTAKGYLEGIFLRTPVPRKIPEPRKEI